MLEAGRQCLDLQSVRHRRRLCSPWNDFRDSDGRDQVLLQRRQHGIGADLHLGIAAVVIAACQSQPGDDDDGQARQRRGLCNLEDTHHWSAPSRRRAIRARPIKPVINRMRTTNPESARPVGTTAV